MKYAIRLPANDSRLRDIEELLTRPVGGPVTNPWCDTKAFLDQAASWKTARRAVAQVEFQAGELFPRVGVIVTSLERPNRAVVRLADQIRALRMKISSSLPHYATRKKRYIVRAVFEVKREIPVYERRCRG